MTRKRKLLFSAIVVVFVFCLIEGTAQIIWWRLQSKAFASRQSAGQDVLRNDALNFMKEPDGVYGYVMKANFNASGIVINSARFHQRDEVPIKRQDGRLRVVCMGESTTFGSNVEANYPHFLRNILTSEGNGYSGFEVVNAGVPGWVSDQVALRAEHQLAAYRPDVVVLYTGWNDFQSYNPFGPAPTQSYFDSAYKGNEWKQYAAGWFKSVALLSALYHRDDGDDASEPAQIPADRATNADRYRFFIQNLDRMVTAFRAANPNVRIFLSTLVGRWPDGTAEEWAKIAPVWWMPRNNVDPMKAAELVTMFNDVLRTYATSRGLPVIDEAAAFADLDRARLQFDWAHMYPDGYELMAWTMFDALVREGVLTRRQQSPREEQLRATYADQPMRLTIAEGANPQR